MAGNLNTLKATKPVIQQELATSSPLPPLFSHTQPPPVVVTQGAEAIIFRTHFLTPEHPCALKYRPAKSWRHPTLDVRLTRHRILSEARTLVKCSREGIRVPAVLSLDWEGGEVEGSKGRRSGGWMMMEWIEGETVRKILDQWLKAVQKDTTGNIAMDTLDKKTQREDCAELMAKIGRAIGKLHAIGVVHGDLTTSNLMLQPESSSTNGHPLAQVPERISLKGEIVIIDFGLASQGGQEEDKAVDLYVLERAFGSTHPTAEFLFDEVLKAYGKSSKKAHIVLKRLEEVRMRGRKRSMLG